jgi:hypothetical protein
MSRHSLQLRSFHPRFLWLGSWSSTDQFIVSLNHFDTSIHLTGLSAHHVFPPTCPCSSSIDLRVLTLMVLLHCPFRNPNLFCRLIPIICRLPKIENADCPEVTVQMDRNSDAIQDRGSTVGAQIVPKSVQTELYPYDGGSCFLRPGLLS